MVASVAIYETHPSLSTLPTLLAHPPSLPSLHTVTNLEEDDGHGGEEGQDRHHRVHVLGACCWMV